MKKPRKDSAAQPAAQALPGQPAPDVAEQQGSAAGAGAQAPVNDTPPEQTSDAEAPETISGASGSEGAPEGNRRLAADNLLTFAFPLPAGIPPQALQGAFVIVKAKSARGRWRAGRQFSPEETSIPFADLSGLQIEALTGDAELIVSLRVSRPD